MMMKMGSLLTLALLLAGCASGTPDVRGLISASAVCVSRVLDALRRPPAEGADGGANVDP